MKGIFITYTQNNLDQTGVGKKIKSQIKIFNENGLNCKEYFMKNRNSKFVRLFYRLPFYNSCPYWKVSENFYGMDFIYLRRPLVMTGYMIKVFKTIKLNNPNVKIIMEIPTYPYDAEIKNFKLSFLLLWRDKFNRRKISGIVDKIATVTDDNEIFGITTIKIKNGIDIDNIKVKNGNQAETKKINICAVAIFKEWHGYERILKGLINYYKNGGKREIVIHFVGDGTEVAYYKNIVSEGRIENNIIFHGMLSGKKLDEIYDLCSLSLGSFGLYKKGIDLSCDLKSRESLARGIPMVVGSKIDVFLDTKFDYCLEFENTDEIVDIEKIIQFHDRIYLEEESKTIINNIREFAQKTVNIQNAMDNVIDYIKKEN